MSPKVLLTAIAMMPVIKLAFAVNYEVHMLNKDEAGRMVCEPAFLKTAPGDIVTFVPISKAHNSEFIVALMPEALGLPCHVEKLPERVADQHTELPAEADEAGSDATFPRSTRRTVISKGPLTRRALFTKTETVK